MKKMMCAAAMAAVMAIGLAVGTAPNAQAAELHGGMRPNNPLCRIWPIWC